MLTLTHIYPVTRPTIPKRLEWRAESLKNHGQEREGDPRHAKRKVSQNRTRSPKKSVGFLGASP